MAQGKILFFARRAVMARYVRTLCGETLARDAADVYDPAAARASFDAGRNDGSVVDLINLCGDYLAAPGEERRPGPTAAFGRFHEAATFERDWRPFFRKNPRFTPQMVLDYLDWTWGLIVTRSELIR